MLFRGNPDTATATVLKAVEAACAYKAAKQAKEPTRRKSVLESTSLPGKLADCRSRDPAESELFIMEGDSASGSAKQGRDYKSQAILPLKGRILNVEEHHLNRVLENDEIRALITVIDGGVGDEFDVGKTRYRRLILMADADVDGMHIRTLLLALPYRRIRPPIRADYVYATQPSLYRICYRGSTYDAMDEAEQDRTIEEGCNGNPTQVQRFKGSGEMNPNQLWDTTMSPENRVLKRITVENAATTDRMFNILMGDAVRSRKQFIKDHANDVEQVDI